MVFASGNSGEDFSWNPFATHPDTISVGATDSTGKRYDFSNYGEAIDIMAPTAGGEKSGTSTYYDRIWSTDNFLKPDCLDDGETPSNGCSDQAGWTPNSPVAGGDGWWGKYSFRFSHTSSAAPFVTGVIALILEANQELSAEEIKEILLVTADRVSASDANYDEFGHSTKYGYGRVNALRAVAAAWVKGGGTISSQLKDDIDESSPCTKDDCWDFEGIEFPDEEVQDEASDLKPENDIDVE
jgi:subtilisin family serine protease